MSDCFELLDVLEEARQLVPRGRDGAAAVVRRHLDRAVYAVRAEIDDHRAGRLSDDEIATLRRIDERAVRAQWRSHVPAPVVIDEDAEPIAA